MTQRIHPQDFIVLIAGAYALLSPIWTTTEDRATTTMIVLEVNFNGSIARYVYRGDTAKIHARQDGRTWSAAGARVRILV